ncbi:SDR family NAD(P)-dependent oxidoreductase [Aspergillus puulaauensis]|uniref:Uncharacterized protein n=1 Tax=Aspergillus puulaauensis TaxID=1220207 RepID=A0A7R7XIH0_9EURO|nr:uncharacterized protein APUU_30099A [Aspergillus puulaauensis]BCS21874.1 hypothetical protein APUU_30099A [Aspergillus puulaauensis]
MPHMSLEGKVAIVTGGTRGIGYGIAIELAHRGAAVLITYVSPGSAKFAQELISKVEKSGGKAAAVQADCCSVDSPKLIVDTAIKTFTGKIDILVNNAGISEELWLRDCTYDHFERVFQTNVRFPMFLAQASLPYLSKGGRILNMSSVAAREAWKMHTVYSASKAAIESFTRTWSLELGHEYGVTVNCINPGPVATEMWDAMPAETQEETQKYIDNVPAAPRLATVDDIAQIATFLCEDEARWITGSTTCANGGAVMV